MASYYPNPSDDRKVSGLTDPVRTGAQGQPAPDSGKETRGNRGGRGKEKIGLSRTGKRLWLSLLVDVVVLLVLVGLILGGWYGFRAIRELYAPAWEVRSVVFGLEIKGVPTDMLEYYQNEINGTAVRSSDRTDADVIGTVIEVQSVLVTQEDGRETLNIRLILEAEAQYREGEGYRMGETMLLAGLEQDFRLKGQAVHGEIVFMKEKEDWIPSADGVSTDGETTVGAPVNAAA
jgi:hypothetical protein